MNFDLNLDNYKKEELEEIFNLPSNYNQSLINVNEQQLTKNILSDSSVDTSIKNKTIAFIAAAKRKLMNLTSTASTITETYKQIYNIDPKLEKSQVAESGSAFIIKPPSTPYAQSSPSEFYQGTINPLNKRILRKSLNIDTRFRENYYGTPSSNFHLDLPMRMTDVVSMQLTALEFPSTFYNVSRVFGNSHFSITIDNETITIVVPDGNYTPYGLCSYLNGYLTDYTTPLNNRFQHITFVTDIDNSGNGSGKMIAGIKSPQAPFEFTLNFQKDKNGLDDRSTPLPLKMGWRMGYRSGLYQGNTSYVGEGIIDMVGPRYIYLVVDDFNNSVNDGFYAAFTSSVLNKNILARISLEGSVFSYLSQNNLSLITNARQYFGPVDLQKLQIQLLDEYGRVLDLNNMDYSFCLTLQSIYDL
jgi:hypothetical protein